MLNIGPPSVSMLLEIEKLVLDEISDFTPNQGISLGPAPEGHRDPIAKLLSNRSKRNFSLIQIGSGESCDGGDYGEGEADDCDSEEENDENEDIRCNSQKDYDIKVATDGNGLRRRKGTKRLVHNNDNLANINNLINTDGVNLELSLDDISDDGCLSPCCQDCRSGLQSPVHIISGFNGESNRHIMASPELNKFLTHEPPDGCEKVNITKDIKKSFRPNQLSHVVLAPCPQKPCNPGFVLLPSQSSAFLPLTKVTNDNLDIITSRLGNTDLGTSINKLG